MKDEHERTADIGARCGQLHWWAVRHDDVRFPGAPHDDPAGVSRHVSPASVSPVPVDRGLHPWREDRLHVGTEYAAPAAIGSGPTSGTLSPPLHCVSLSAARRTDVDVSAGSGAVAQRQSARGRPRSRAQNRAAVPLNKTMLKSSILRRRSSPPALRIAPGPDDGELDAARGHGTLLRCGARSSVGQVPTDKARSSRASPRGDERTNQADRLS